MLRRWSHSYPCKWLVLQCGWRATTETLGIFFAYKTRLDITREADELVTKLHLELRYFSDRYFDQLLI